MLWVGSPSAPEPHRWPTPSPEKTTPPSRPNLVVRLDAMPRWLCVLVSDERPAVAAAVKEVAGGGDALLLGLLSKGAAHILCPTRRQRHPARQAVRP